MDNNNNNKNNNKNKTINLEDKKTQKESHKNSNTSTNEKHCNKSSKEENKNQSKQEGKIISYGITKKKKTVKRVFFKNRSPLLILAVFLIVYFIAYSIKSNSSDTKVPSQNNFVSIDPSVDQSDFSHYANIISSSVRDIINVPNEESIITEKMHKNGLEILAQGYFYWENGKKVYFDVTLQQEKLTSLLINRKEYVK